MWLSQGIKLGKGWKFAMWNDMNDLARGSFTFFKVEWKWQKYLTITFMGLCFFFWNY
jgi:hypothetical protein